MTKLGTVFRFAAPDHWSQLQDGNRYIFHGPNGEELIVSASLIQGGGSTGDLAAAQKKLFQTAHLSVNNAAKHPDLKIIQPFQRDSRVSQMECWSLLGQTCDGGTLFYQAVFRDPRGVLLASLEAPNTAASTKAFEEFIISVGVISET